MTPLQIRAADAIHPYFTASKYYPTDMDSAWEDGKKNYIRTQQDNVDQANNLTLSEYCSITGARI